MQPLPSHWVTRARSGETRRSAAERAIGQRGAVGRFVGSKLQVKAASRCSRLRFDPQVGERLFQNAVQDLDVPCRTGRAAGARGEDADRGSRAGGGPSAKAAPRRPRWQLGESRGGGAPRASPVWAAKATTVGVRLELVALGPVAIPPAVDEIETEGPAGELERPRRRRRDGRVGRSRKGASIIDYNLPKALDRLRRSVTSNPVNHSRRLYDRTTASRPTLPATEAVRFADQLERSFRGGAWQGPSLTEALAGVTATAAVPPAGRRRAQHRRARLPRRLLARRGAAPDRRRSGGRAVPGGRLAVGSRRQERLRAGLESGARPPRGEPSPTARDRPGARRDALRPAGRRLGSDAARAAARHPAAQRLPHRSDRAAGEGGGTAPSS